jgi:plasmid stability protein
MEPVDVQHPELTLVFESLVRAASALLLVFQLDLASSTVSLARRVRTASLSASPEAEVRSILAGVEGLGTRIQRLPSPLPRELETALEAAMVSLKGFQPQRRELIPA